MTGDSKFAASFAVLAQVSNESEAFRDKIGIQL
jgi:hypothetical protein